MASERERCGVHVGITLDHCSYSAYVLANDEVEAAAGAIVSALAGSTFAPETVVDVLRVALAKAEEAAGFVPPYGD